MPAVFRGSVASGSFAGVPYQAHRQPFAVLSSRIEATRAHTTGSSPHLLYAQSVSPTKDKLNPPPHQQALDRICRILLGHPQMLLDLLNGYFRFAWARQVDPASMENRTLPSITPNLVERRHDTVWRVPLDDNRSHYVCVMVEFQKSRPWNMAMRMLGYVTALYDSMMARQELGDRHSFPPVLPIVIYFGEGDWTPKLEVDELIEPVPEGLEGLQVSHRYLLLDVRRLQRLDASAGNRVEALFRLERSEKPEDLDRFVAMVQDLFPGEGYDDFKRAIIGWAHHVMQKALPDERLPEPDSVQEVQEMLQANVLPWGEQKRAEGHAEGRAEQRKELEELIVKMARSRFGDAVAQKLSARLASEQSTEYLMHISGLIYSCSSGDTLLDQLRQQEA